MAGYAGAPFMVPTMEEIMAAMGGMKSNLLTTPVQTPGYIPAPAPVLPPAPATATSPVGAPPGPGMGGGGFWDFSPEAWQRSLDTLGKTWSTPGAASQTPFPRGDQNSPFANILAGFGNNLLGTPQNIWNAGSAFTGVGSTEAAGQAGRGIWDFFTKPEGVSAAENAPPEDTGGGFTPGIPDSFTSKTVGVESGGNRYAKNPNSSAYGPGQFIKSTWREFMRETNPELLKNSSEEEVLALRSDPEWANKAISWYAGKGIDALDDLNLPATDTNLYLNHFLGTQGMKNLLSADPNAAVSSVLTEDQIKANASILGGNRSVQDVLDWAAAKMGEGAGMRPTPRPVQEMPDFTKVNNWLDQAAPQAMSDQTLKELQLSMMLEGLGAGLASVDAGRQGGGALFGALGAGGASGLANVRRMQAEFEQQLNADKRDYALLRAETEMGQEGSRTQVRQANAENAWADENDARAYDNANIQAQRAKMMQSPKIVESSDKGLWIQGPEGDLTFLSNTNPWDEMENMKDVFGVDSNQFRQIKYSQMAQSGNLLSIEMEIIKDLLHDGLGASIWGEGYSEALAAAEEQLPAGLAADPAKALPELNKIMSGLLLGSSQQFANYDWIQQAAAMGHPGAMMLVQGGTLGE